MAESENPDAHGPEILDQKCELCEINNISYKCQNCDEIICYTCMKIHLKSKATKDHKIVGLQSAEIFKNNPIEKKCSCHIKEDLTMYCNTCDCPICRECITSGVHLNHPMVKVEDVIDIKQKQLSRIIRQINEKSKKYQNIIKIIAQNKLEFSQSIAKRIKEVKDRNNKLKSRLDKLASEYTDQLQSMDKENKKTMTELEQRLQQEIPDLNQLMQQCKHKHRDRNIEMVKFVADVTQRLNKYKPCDPQDLLCPPDLISRHVDDQELKHLFGQLDIKKIPPANPPLQRSRNSLSTSPALDIQIVVSFTRNKTRVVTTGYDQAWLWRWGGTDISLVKSDGEVREFINTDLNVFDAAVSKSGDLFVTEYNGNKVKKLTRNMTFTAIYTAADVYDTRGITFTDSENVLVVLHNYNDSKIVEITTSGQHIRTIQYDPGDNKLLFDKPWIICTNINGDIIVIQNSEVVVVNLQGKKRFKYTGEGRKLKKSFVPTNDVVTDKHGYILISDYYNSVVHVLDSDGKFVQYLMTPEHGCDRPVGLDIDDSGRLWVCNEGSKQILIVKYV